MVQCTEMELKCIMQNTTKYRNRNDYLVENGFKMTHHTKET